MIERSCPSIYFAEKYAGKFTVGEPVDPVVLERARDMLRKLHERARKTRITPYARIVNLHRRG